MADRACHRTAHKMESAHKGFSNISVLAVTFYLSNIEYVLLNVTCHVTAHNRQHDLARLGNGNPWKRVHDLNANLASAFWGFNHEALCGYGALERKRVQQARLVLRRGIVDEKPIVVEHLFA